LLRYFPEANLWFTNALPPCVATTMGLSLRDLNAQENDEATPVGQRLQPETAKLHVQANDPQEAQVALEKLEKMPGILNVAGIMCGMGQSSPWEHMNG